MKERETLGDLLKRERELKNISLKELAKKTRVREHFLKAIEEDKFEILPSPVYIKGFLTAYAKSIGLDPHEVLLSYERSLKGGPPVVPEAKSEKKLEKKSEKWQKKKSLKKFISGQKQIWVVSGVIAISFLISYFFHPYLSGPPVERPQDKPEVQETPSPVTTADIPETFFDVENEPFSLTLKAIEETWIRIQVNGQPPTEILFKPGEEVSYQRANRIELLIGNAGGLSLVFNGKALEKSGRSGEVVALVFTPRGAEKKRQ